MAGGRPAGKAHGYPADPAAYRLAEPVGEGGAGTVWRADCLPLQEIVAVKLVQLERVGVSLDHLMQEVAVMRRCAHTNVLRVCSAFVAGAAMWLVSEYHPFGSVLDLMAVARPQGLHGDEGLAAAVLAQALAGLAHVHSVGQAHRDIKAANLLVAGDGCVRVADFGIATEAQARGRRCRASWAGSPCWMAPEAMVHGRPAGTPQDLWALGVTALELAVGLPPYHDQPPMKVFSLVLRRDPPSLRGPQHAHAAAALSAAYHAFAARCLVKDPAARPTAEAALHDPLFGGFSAPGSASRCVSQWLHDNRVPTLSSVPGMAYNRPPQPSGAAAAAAAAAAISGVEWDFPPTPPQRPAVGAPPPQPPPQPPAAATWRAAAADSHSAAMAAYQLTGPPALLGRVTATPATMRGSGTPVTLHRASVASAGAASAPLLSGRQAEEAVDALLALSDPALLACHEAWEDGVGTVCWVTDPLPPETLAHRTSRSHPGAEELRRWAAAAAEALWLLHEHGLHHHHLHGDVCYISEGGELVVDAAGPLLLAVSAPPSSDPGSAWALLPPPGGLPREAYLPPEDCGAKAGRALPSEQVSALRDVYQFGLLCVHIASGAAPYGDVSGGPGVIRDLKKQQREPTQLWAEWPAVPEPLSRAWRDMLSRCLGPAAQRPGLGELRRHPLLLPNAALSGLGPAAAAPAAHHDHAPSGAEGSAASSGGGRRRRAKDSPRGGPQRRAAAAAGAAIAACAAAEARREPGTPQDPAAPPEAAPQPPAAEQQGPQPAMVAARCPHCLRPPTDPRLLDCGHSLCFGCARRGYAFARAMHSLLRLTSGWAFGEPERSLVCPQCGATTTVPPEPDGRRPEAGSDSSDTAEPADARRTQLLGALPRGAAMVPLCDHCEEAPAELECAQCEVALCRSCSSNLHQRGRFKTHEVTPLSGAAGLPVRDATPQLGAELLEQLRARDADLGRVEVRLQQHVEQVSADGAEAQRALRALFAKAAEGLARRERHVTRRLRDAVAQRVSITKRHIGVVRQLRSQIGVAVSANDPCSAIAVRRFQSLLATPCANEPQQATLRVAVGDSQLSQQPITRLGQVVLQTVPLAWRAPPGPAAEAAARVVATVAGCAACCAVSPSLRLGLTEGEAGGGRRWAALRVRPIGLPEGGSWVVRQLLIFDPTGTNLATDPRQCTASGAAGPESQGHHALTGPHGRATAGKWAAPQGSRDDSWLCYRLPEPAPEVDMVVVRSYPDEKNSPQSVLLEGISDGGSGEWEALLTEEVGAAGSGSGSRDCMITL
eukprot:TRINITY_DN6517_c0_g4_i1.p1 TRINITY_DN6517_c0_g4~~TRINITY_DN6517_c0_g4_i1.p1  ORF type:complete len:1283 (+),score=308.29 TRINITY_DN6517_c0_g4_i1:92-3940(+)